MLLRVGVDPDAGEELAGSLMKPGRLLVRYLKERCLLVAEPRSAADLVRAFHGAPPELAQAITLLVGQRLTAPPMPKPAPLCDLETWDQVGSWENVVDLLVLAEYRLAVLRDEAKGDVLPEISSLREALNSDAVFSVNELWETHLRKGTNREAVWGDRFATLAAHTRRVHIIDRYAAANLARLLVTKQKTKHKSGAQWFLEHLARSPVESIYLVSSARELPDNRSADEVEMLIRRWFTASGTNTKLHLHVVGGNFEHGRRIAFEGWAGFELHNGLASFDKPALSEGMSLNASGSLARDIVIAAKALAAE